MTATVGGPPPSATGHVKDYWLVVLKHGWWVLAILVVSGALTYFLTERQTKKYRSAAVIEMVPPRATSSGDLFAPTIFRDASYLNTQLVKLQMRETLHDAIVKGELVGHDDFGGMSKADIVRAAAGNVSASQRRSQYLVDVSITGTKHRILDDITNALVVHFRDMQRDESETRRKVRQAELDEQIASKTSRIRIREVEKRAALEQQGFNEATFDSEYEKLSADRQRFLDERSAVEIRIIKEKPTYSAFSAAVGDGSEGPESLSQHPAVLRNVEVRAVLDEISSLRAEQTELKATRGVGRKDPEYQALDRAIGRLEGRRRDVQAAFVRNFVLEYEGLEAQQVAFDRKVVEKDRDLKEATAVKARVDEINAEIGRLSADKSAAQRELELIAPSAFGSIESVKIIAFAGEPNAGNPVSPNKPANYAMGAVLGLLGGIGMAFLAEYLDDTIRSKEELAKISDAPLLGVIPRISGRKKETEKRDLIVHVKKKSTVSEAFRGVRTALTLRGRRTKHNVLLFTSAGPKEGKTTNASNTACVLAQSGERVLLIDADLRKPRVHKSFGLTNDAGLSTLLTRDDPTEAYTRPTEVPGVDVLTSGPIPPNPAELLGSERMRDVLRELRSRYDHIIIDTPPIGAVTDAAVLGTMVDGVILVVHAGKTRRGVVSRGLEQLRYIDAPIEGVILNNLSLRKLRYYPGYHSYYYYYSYYGSGRTTKTDDTTPGTAGTEPENAA